MSKSEDTEKYQVDNDKTVQGSVIGDHATVHQHFYATQDEATSSSTKPQRVWNVPYLRNPFFTGRDELLDRLAQQLAPEVQAQKTTTRRAALTQPQAIKGLGGIGKTQIALRP